MKVHFTPVGVSFDDVPQNVKLLSVGSKLQFLHVPAFYGTGERRKEYPNAIAIMFGDKKVGAVAESSDEESPQQSILRLIKEGKSPVGTVIEMMTPNETQTFKPTYKIEVEVPEVVKVAVGTFVELETFTGEKILYDEVNHKYKDLDGNALVSGSQYKKSLEKPFPAELMAGKVATKYGISPQTVSDMWNANGLISRTFGTALHLAMEQWFKYRDSGCEDKEYNLAKHPFLRGAVLSFPLKDEPNVEPECLISDVANRRVGRIDLLTITGDKEGYVEDYKSDADIGKNLAGHYVQLSFYAKILIEKGWNIRGVRVWNYAGNGWEVYESEVLIIK